jgi:hypothetical protein
MGSCHPTHNARDRDLRLPCVPRNRVIIGNGPFSRAPSRLTAYGHELWELDALLHDTFGKSLVYLRAGNACLAANFTLAFTAVASGGPYAFTFADASHSSFTDENGTTTEAGALRLRRRHSFHDRWRIHLVRPWTMAIRR